MSAQEGVPMFGAFRFNETTRNLEHVGLSSEAGLDARGYTSMACVPCRVRKVSVWLLLGSIQSSSATLLILSV